MLSADAVSMLIIQKPFANRLHGKGSKFRRRFLSVTFDTQDEENSVIYSRETDGKELRLSDDRYKSYG